MNINFFGKIKEYFGACVEIYSIIQKQISDYINDNIYTIKDSCIIVFVEQEVNKQELYKTIENLRNCM